MAILADYQYTLGVIKDREKMGNIPELDQEIISKINKISKRVGAPSYKKTPVFKRNYYKRANKMDISNEDWESIRNFKTTKLEKHIEGIEAQMDTLRSYLNKLTSKNYSEILECIISIINDIIKNEKNDVLEKIGKSIFEIGSVNKFWADLYARLYKDLIHNFKIMKNICTKNFESFESIFNTINYSDPSINYNLFCEYNKQNEKRRALSSFFMICAKHDIIEKKQMVKLILNLLDKINKYIFLEQKENTVEEIAENTSIMITKGKVFLVGMNEYSFIKNEIAKISQMNSKNYPSLTQKIIFKFMDLNDELEE